MRTTAVLGAVELLRDKPPVPTQDRVGFHDTRDLVEGLLTETPSYLSQRPPFAIGQAQATLDLISKNSILRGEVLVPEE